jgi:hydrogenase maturation protease
LKTLVLGIGNTLLGDDGVGVYAARELAKKISDENVTIMDTAIDGLNLLDVIRKYERMIVIDAILDDLDEAGTIFRLTQDQIPPPSSSGASSHNLNLATTLKIGNNIFPGEMPREVVVFAVASQNVDYVTEEMTDNVKEALPQVVEFVIKELGL